MSGATGECRAFRQNTGLLLRNLISILITIYTHYVNYLLGVLTEPRIVVRSRERHASRSLCLGKAGRWILYLLHE